MTLALSQSVGLDSGLDVDITPVAGALGAEVRGLDPQAPGDAPTWDRCRSDKTAASGYYGLAGLRVLSPLPRLGRRTAAEVG